MKKIRRTRIRTETSKLVFIQEQPGEPQTSFAGHEFCPACGQPLPAPVKDIAALPAVCADLHDDGGSSSSAREGVLELKEEEK